MSPTRVYRQFSGAKLRKAREELGISRNKLAPFIGCTVMTLLNWELGRRTPGSQYLDALAVQLRKTVDYFYDVQDPEDNAKG